MTGSVENRTGSSLLSELDRLAVGAQVHAMYWRLAREGTLEKHGVIREARKDPSPRLVKVPLFFGLSMTVDLREAVSQQLYLTGSFEEGLSRFFYLALEEGMTFFDVGAHFGYFTLLARSQVGAAGRVVAFEPTPRTREQLAQNTISFANIELEERAVWYESTHLRLNDYGQDWSAFNSIGGMRTEEHLSRPPIGSFDVEAVPLDEFCAERGLRPDVIKIDAESAELQVLQGMETLLSQKRPLVTVEVGDFAQLEESTPSSRAILAHLQSRDYGLFEPRIDGLVPHAIQDRPYEYDNVVGVPRERIAALAPPILRAS